MGFCWLGACGPTQVKRTCFVGVLQLVRHLGCCYILASRTFNLNTKCCWFQKKTKSVQLYRHVQLQLHRHVAFLLCLHQFLFSCGCQGTNLLCKIFCLHLYASRAPWYSELRVSRLSEPQKLSSRAVLIHQLRC